MTTTNANTNRLRRPLRAFARILELALEAIWPDTCLICGRSTLGTRRSPFRRDPPLETLLCPECQKKLVAPAHDFCERCAAAIPPGSRCRLRHDSGWYFDEVRPLHAYYGLARAVVLRLKRSKDRRLVAAIARLYYQSRRQELEDFAPDCVVAVPMHWGRKLFLRRGVNSPDALARRLAKELKIPNMSRRVRRIRATPAQTSVEWTERVANISGAFAVPARFGAAPFSGMRALVVDDAFTSGATANELSRVLVDAGAVAVFVAALTRGGLGKRPSSTKKTP